VLRHHRNDTRDGVYVDAAFTHQAAAAMHRDSTFNASTQGATYAQPLYLDGGAAGGDRLFVATEQNWVYALDAATGAAGWSTHLAPPVPLSLLPCGNIDPLGVTGTPVIDYASRTLFVDAMTTPDGGTTKRHLIFALSVDDGSIRPGYPVDVAAALAGLGVTARHVVHTLISYMPLFPGLSGRAL
jgi:outer membrane protein assembly factor BamB